MSKTAVAFWDFVPDDDSTIALQTGDKLKVVFAIVESVSFFLEEMERLRNMENRNFRSKLRFFSPFLILSNCLADPR
jgi:hypothetical protein